MQEDETSGERADRHQKESVGRNWASARTLLSGLILAGVIAIIGTQINARDQAAQDRQDSRVQAATIMGQIANIQYNIVDVPSIRANMTKMQTVQQELLRRQEADEAYRERERDRISTTHHER